MKRFILELRRREVFRTAGLYVGISWILIEASSVMLPTFGAPDWILRWVIIAAVIGFPIMLVLAWVFDVTDKGIEIQVEATETVVIPVGRRRMDFVVIGVLAVALLFSVYLNIMSVPDVIENNDPVSVLIADFDNQTGNPLFDGSLEQALNIGIEGAAFITAYPRANALSQARNLELGESLDHDTARLVAVRQDVRMVLAGGIVADGDNFDLSMVAVDPTSGEALAKADARAAGSAEVLVAINELAAGIREELGDNSEDLQRLQAGETVTAASIEAIKAYTTAQDLARAGRDEDAINAYRQAVEEDPELARAYSGWALSAFKIGRQSEADEQWQKALSLMDRMTERERFRTLGLYYTAVSLNYNTAIENYQQLVEKFPADGAGNNNLAILYAYTTQYDKAFAQSEKLLQIYPGRTIYHYNHALYAIYAGDVATARAEAEHVISEDPSYFKAYLILAVTALYDGDVAAATAHYERMAEIGVRGESLANVGLADIAIFEGRFEDAVETLTRGIEKDRAENNERGAGTKTIALAQAQIALGRIDEGVQLIAELAATRGDGQLVPSAAIFASAERFDDAFRIGEAYRQQLRPSARAYASLIDGINAFHQGEYVTALDAYRQALELADLWIVRYYNAQAYLDGGFAAEASGEIENLIGRRNEAAIMFLDDVPTWRYTVPLETWKAEAAAAISDLSASADR